MTIPGLDLPDEFVGRIDDPDRGFSVWIKFSPERASVQVAAFTALDGGTLDQTLDLHLPRRATLRQMIDAQSSVPELRGFSLASVVLASQYRSTSVFLHVESSLAEFSTALVGWLETEPWSIPELIQQVQASERASDFYLWLTQESDLMLSSSDHSECAAGAR